MTGPEPMSEEQVEDIANDGHRNAVGGIYATAVHQFAAAIESARDAAWSARLAEVEAERDRAITERDDWESGYLEALKATAAIRDALGMAADGVPIDRTIQKALALRTERDRLAAEVETHRKSAAWCDKHQPNGGQRGTCLVCACQSLSAALSRISYLCGEPNEMECGPYDVHADETAVVAQVETLRSDFAALQHAIVGDTGASAIVTVEALRADAKRYRWLRDISVPPHNFYLSVPIEFDGVKYSRAEVDATIDAARAAGGTNG